MKIFYFSSTHWDREWYQTFQGFRRRLVETTEGVCRHLEGDHEFGVFHFDGQTIVLEDVFEVRPDLRPRMQKLIDEGRVLIGPWYVMPDEFLVSGEALIRNLALGHRIAGEYNTDAWKFGYVCDIFGHIAQFPQILAGFGIDYALLGRGTNEETTDRYFRWESPDGTQVITLKLRDWYGYGDFNMNVFGFEDLRVDEATFKERAKRYIDELRSTTDQPVLFLMDGIDHAPIHSQTTEFLRWIRELYPNAEVRHTNFHAAGAALEPYRSELQVKRGELIEPTKEVAPYSHLITNTLSSYYPLKRWNDELQTMLECVVAPIVAITRGDGGGSSDLRPYEDLAWRTLLKNHPHDSIGGCSIARVHKDMEYRFAQVEDLCTEITSEFLERDAQTRRGEVPAAIYYTEPVESENAHVAIRLFNSLPYQRDEVLSLAVDLPAGFSPTFAEPFGYEAKPQILLRDSDGRERSYRLTKLEKNVLKRTFNQHTRTVDRLHVTTRVVLPALGWTTLTVEPSERPIRYLDSLLTGPRTAENDALRLTVEANGTVTVFDKRARKEYRGLNQFVADTEIGDGWYHVNAVDNAVSYSIGSAADIAVVENAPDRVTFRVAQSITLPAELVWHGTLTEAYSGVGESSERVAVPITSLVSLSSGDAQVGLSVRVENRARDYRLRMIVPTGIAGDWFAYQTFAFLTRPAGRSRGDETASWKELEPVEKNFSAIVGKRNGDGAGIAFFSKAGLHEVGTFDDESGSLYITLLRAFRRTVMTDGEPEGQLQQELSYETALCFFDGGRTDAELYRAYQRFAAPVLTYSDRRHAADPSEDAVLRVSGRGIVVTTVKRADVSDAGSRDDIVCRVVNLSGEASEAVIELAAPVSGAELVDLLEQPIDGAVTIEGDGSDGGSVVTVPVGPWKIVTVRITRRR